MDFVASVKARIGWKALTADEYQDEGYAFLATPNIKGREIDFTNVNYISPFRYEESPELKLQVGDVLLAKDGSTLGIANTIRKLPRPATVNGSVAVIRPSRVDPVFLTHWLQGSFIQGQIQQLKDGMGVPHLFQADIRKLPVPALERAEQRRIADFLDDRVARIDQIIASRRRQLTALDEIKSGVVNETLLAADSSEIPIWMVTRRITDGAHVSPETELGEFDFVSTRDVSIEGTINFDAALKTSASSYEMLARQGCQPELGDVLFSKDGTVGRTALVTERRAFVVASSLIIIRPDPSRVNSLFLHYMFKHPKVLSQVDAFVKGAGLPRISIANLKKVIGVFPDLVCQRQIGEALGTRFGEMRAYERGMMRSIHLLTEYKQSLITAAVTGELDVTTAASGITG